MHVKSLKFILEMLHATFLNTEFKGILVDLFTCRSNYLTVIFFVNMLTLKADELDSLNKFCILSENIIFHE